MLPPLSWVGCQRCFRWCTFWNRFRRDGGQLETKVLAWVDQFFIRVCSRRFLRVFLTLLYGRFLSLVLQKLVQFFPIRQGKSVDVDLRLAVHGWYRWSSVFGWRGCTVKKKKRSRCNNGSRAWCYQLASRRSNFHQIRTIKAEPRGSTFYPVAGNWQYSLEQNLKLPCCTPRQKGPSLQKSYWNETKSKMPPIRTTRNKKPPPAGFDDIEDTLLEFSNKMKDAENASHEGKKRHEVHWPIFQISHQSMSPKYKKRVMGIWLGAGSKYIYDLYYEKEAISKQLYDWLLKNKYADANLIAKWKKQGYEKVLFSLSLSLSFCLYLKLTQANSYLKALLSPLHPNERNKLQLDLHLPCAQSATQGRPSYSVRELWVQGLLE